MSPSGTPHAQPFYFFGDAGHRLFGVLHRPARDVKGAWVFCSPFGEERDNAQRVLVEWARLLCERGFWVLRFDHRGNGNSDGQFEDYTTNDYLDDIGIAIRVIEERSGVACCGLCGLRFGSTLAAGAAVRDGRDLILVLFEPIVNGQEYADELLRIALATHMSSGPGSPITRDQLKERLAAGGNVAIRGHIITHRIYQSIAAVNMAVSVPRIAGPMLIVEISPSRRKVSKPALKLLYDALASLGDVTFHHARIQLPWVLTNTEYDVRPDALFNPTLEWILEKLAEKNGGTPRGPTRSVVGFTRAEEEGSKHAERAVGFEVEGVRAWGILQVPKNHQPGRPYIVMPRMSARLQVYIARALGAAGWATLRFNERGKGESEGHLEFPTIEAMHWAVQNGYLQPDFRGAIDYLEREFGTRSVILFGICGDAITSVFLGAQDPRVVGIMPCQLALHYTPQSKMRQRIRRVRSVFAPLFSKRNTLTRFVRARAERVVERYGKAKSALRRRRPSKQYEGILEEMRSDLGEWANVAMLAAFLRCLERHLPMLCVFGGAWQDGPSAFVRLMPLFRRVSKDGADRIAYHVIAASDHHFSVPAHTEQLLHVLLGWLEDPHQPWNAGKTSL